MGQIQIIFSWLRKVEEDVCMTVYGCFILVNI